MNERQFSSKPHPPIFQLRYKNLCIFSDSTQKRLTSQDERFSHFFHSDLYKTEVDRVSSSQTPLVAVQWLLMLRLSSQPLPQQAVCHSCPPKEEHFYFLHLRQSLLVCEVQGRWSLFYISIERFCYLFIILCSSF
jgi:hypothetical protein